MNGTAKKGSAPDMPAGMGKEDIIGQRTFETGTPGMLLPLIVWFITGILMSIPAFWFSADYDWYTEEFIGWDTTMLALGIFMLIFAFAPMIWYASNAAARRRNNRCKDPTIAVRPDGRFVLYHANGAHETLNDTVQDVNYEGNKVTFVLGKQTGERYMRSVKHVDNASSAVTRMKNILSYKDGAYVLTNYEKARLFCQYCGSKVSPAENACSYCGGRVTQ